MGAGDAVQKREDLRRRPLSHRILFKFLDVRPRWWLSLLLWVPFGIATLMVTAAFQNNMGNSSRSMTSAFRIVEDGLGGFRVTAGNDHSSASWLVRYSIGFDFTRWRRTAFAECQIVPEIAQTPDGRYEAALVTVADRVADVECIRSLAKLQHPEAAPWFRQTWRELLARGEAQRTGRSVLLLIQYVVLEALRWACLGGMALAIVSWFARGAQVGACRRVLKRHDAGLCPECRYDVSGAPSQPCPECGCDHRERFREAVCLLREAHESDR
jgi:hypothetical protein